MTIADHISIMAAGILTAAAVISVVLIDSLLFKQQ